MFPLRVHLASPLAIENGCEEHQKYQPHRRENHDVCHAFPEASSHSSACPLLEKEADTRNIQGDRTQQERKHEHLDATPIDDRPRSTGVLCFRLLPVKECDVEASLLGKPIGVCLQRSTFAYFHRILRFLRDCLQRPFHLSYRDAELHNRSRKNKKNRNRNPRISM